MKKPLSREEVVQKFRSYYKEIVVEKKPKSYGLNIALTSNPFLKNQDGFRFLVAQLKDFNSRVDRDLVKDPYEILSFQRVHSMLSDLAQI